MSKNIEHPHLSTNGGKQYYLQFHIKPWMKLFLPSEYRNRKNIKQSLKTPSLLDALNKMPIQLAKLGLALDPHTQEIIPSADRIVSEEKANQLTNKQTPEQNYNQARSAASIWPDTDIEYAIDIEEEIFVDQIEDLLRTDPVEAKRLSAQHYAKKEGYLRVLNKEDTLLNPSPHKYETTLKAAAELLITDYQEDGRSIKTIGKVNISTRKFLEFLGVPDIKLSQITLRHVKKYIKQGRRSEIPLNTFSMELGLLDKAFKIAQEEGVISDNLANPFLGHRPLRGFKGEEPKAPYLPEHAEILAAEAVNAKRYDILAIVAISYYTGVRCSELYGCTLTDEKGILCLDICEGKTLSSVRKVPLHQHLITWLNTNKLMPQIGNSFGWSATSKDAFNKRFNRFSDRYLLAKHGINENKGTLSHHSFRHGMSTRLFKLGLNELQVAHVVGHSRETSAKTTSGKVYIKETEIPEIRAHINLIEPINFPNISNENLPAKL
jgi:integrase